MNVFGTQKGQKSLFIKDLLTQAEKGKAYYYKKFNKHRSNNFEIGFSGLRSGIYLNNILPGLLYTLRTLGGGRILPPPNSFVFLP